uniref:Uncharacterized protein n=1 Tax=Oryza rufipogon TaxID=4529 RepID=A0A0E0Q5J0_ORYRU
MDAAAASSSTPASSPRPAESSGGVEMMTTHGTTLSGAPQVGVPTAMDCASATSASSSAAAEHGADGDKLSSPHDKMASDIINKSSCSKFDKEKPDQEVVDQQSGSLLIYPGYKTNECSQNSFGKICEEEIRTVCHEKVEESLRNDPLPLLVRADSDSRPTFQESCSSDRPREKQPTKSDEDIDLYFYRIRLKEVLDEKEYLVHELECARQQLDEVRSMNSEILRENRKLKRSLRTRAVEGISRNVLEKLGYCHDIFLCPNEVDVEKLQELLCRSECKLLYTVKIPGATTDHSWKVDTLAKMSPFCKVVFLGMIEDVYRLHRSGLCLNGKFSLKDFCWTLSQKVKFSAELKRSVLRRKLKRMRLDYQKLCEIMIEVLEECKVKIPADLEYLLDLMRDDPVKHQFLIRYNFCLMDDILKREETLTMFTQYEQLNREDREKHGKTTREYRTEIAVSFITLPRNIGSAMLANKFVAKIFERWRVETGFYSLDTRRKLIELIRHCMVHLPEKAFDEEKRTHYTDANVVDMFKWVLHRFSVSSREA